MNSKKQALSTVNKAIKYQTNYYKKYKRSRGNCIVLISFFDHGTSDLFIKLFRPLCPIDEYWMRLPINPNCELTEKQIYEDRLTALLFLKEYIKQHGVTL